MQRALFSVSMLFCLAAEPPLSATEYRFAKISVPGSIQTEAYGINARGDIVGSYVTPDEVRHGFLLRGGVFTTIEVPGALETGGARGINARGDITGNITGEDELAHAFLLRDGQFTEIRFPGATETIAEKINNAGDVVGAAFSEERTGGFLLKDGMYQTVDVPGAEFELVRGSQDNGLVLVGHAVMSSDGGTRGFVRRGPREFELIEYPGLEVPCTGARAINQRGDIVGGFAIIDSADICYPPFVESHGYLLRDGQFTLIDFPGAPVNDAFAINDDGVIVGRFTDARGRTRGFMAVPEN
jgi:probable HAF family extracellular repeat protein